MLKNVLLLDDGSEIVAGYVGQNAIMSLSHTAMVSSTTDLVPGAACSAKIEATIWVEPGGSLVITSGTRMRYYREDASGARTLVGTFWAVKPTRQTRNTYKVLAYDVVSKLDGIQSTWLRSIQGDFPMTIWAFARRVAQRCTVEIANAELPRNGDYSVAAFYSDNLTGRQMLSWVAQAACTFLRATPDGKLEFAWYETLAGYGISPGTNAEGVYTALDLSGQLLATADGEVWTFAQPQAGYFSGTLSYEDYTTAPIDKVQIRQSDDDVGVIYPPDEAGTNALVLQGNLLLATQTADALRPVARAIFEQMQGVTYTPLQVSIPLDAGAPAPGEIITVTDAYGRTMQAYIMQRTISGQKVTLESTGNASRDGTAAVNEQKYTNLEGKLLEIRTSVDGLNVKASDLSGKYTELSQTVDGLTVTAGNLQDDYTQLTQTINGLELTVVKDGEVRTKFAADATSVTISSGVIGFTSNSITIDSTNFKLDATGNVTATGTFSSNNGVSGSGRNTSNLTSGGLYLYRTTSDGQERPALSVYGYGQNACFGYFDLYGTLKNNGQDLIAQIYGDFNGSHMSLQDATSHGTITFNGGSGSAEFEGNVDIQGPVGLGVSKTVKCQTLDAWGGKSRVVPTSVGAIKMAAFETPEPSFADSGSAQLDADGRCLIVLDPLYAETLERLKALRWMITPTAEGTAWVEKRDGCAMVHGTPGLAFDWLCIGAQSGYGDIYAERCYDSPPLQRSAAENLLDWIDFAERSNKKAADELLDAFAPLAN